MELSADSETLPTHTTVEGPVSEQSLPSTQRETETGGTVLLQLLEFKTHLLEAVEELHIRRDAETSLEDQLSVLVSNKQELEWEKESLHQEIETMTSQHMESLTNVKKQFQAKIRNIEEEKGKYQVSVELKDKEINSLKEELKSLQLLKYNLENKSSKLEQKLALQSRSKDSHLNQLGEVEKRFSALSRQCAVIKQAHEKLEQNVDEAMRINKKLSSANEKQEATIVSLMKDVEEVSKKLIKAKMTSFRHEKTHTPTGKDQHIQQLHQKLNMETEMNTKLREENDALRAEKKEVMKSLQHAQQLLLSQTQTVSRAELELQTQRERYQALKQEHDVMREKSKAVEDKLAQLMENYAASKTSWDKEKTVFLDGIKIEEQDFQAVKAAYDELYQKHTELSSQAKVQAQRIYQLEMRDSCQSVSVSTQFFSTLVEDVRAEELLSEPISNSELPSFGHLHLASSQAKNPDCLEDTGAVTITTGGQGPQNNNQKSQFTVKGVGSTTTVSRPVCKSTNGSVGLLMKRKDENKEGNMNEKKHRGLDELKRQNNYSKEEESNKEQHRNIEEVLSGEVKEGGSNAQKKRTIMAQTTDRADRQEENKGSAEDAGDTRNPETETRDRAQGEGTNGVKERGKTALHTSEAPKTQIQAQTTADTTVEKSNTRQVIDFMDTEPSLTVSKPSDSSQSLSPKVIENDADFSHVSKGCGVGREEQLPHILSIDQEPNPVIQGVQYLYYDEVQTQDTKPLNQLPCESHRVSHKTTENTSSDKSAADFLTKYSEPLNQPVIYCSHTNAAPLAPQTDGLVSIQETNTAQTSPSIPPDITVNGKQMDEICNAHGSEECLLVGTLVESQSLPQSQEISEQETRQGKSLVTDGNGGNPSAYRKCKGQSDVNTQEKYCKTFQEPVEKSNLKDAYVNVTMDTVDLVSEVDSASWEDLIKNAKLEQTGDGKTIKSKVDLHLHNNECAESSRTHCSEQPPAKEMLLDNTDESALPSKKTYRSPFDWSGAQRKTAISRTKSDFLILHQFVEGTEQNTSWSGGNPGHLPSTKSMFLKSENNKASLRRHQHNEWKAIGETYRETIAADTESRASLSISSFPGSASSSTVSRLLWQPTPGCSRAHTSAVGHISDWEPSSSQESEDQQSSFRTQISKIEQFLYAERLRLPKRQRTDN